MTWRDTVDSFYDDEIEEFYEQGRDRVLDESLSPRGPSLLFDVAADLGTGPSTRVLDVGSRVGKQMVELRDRFGCRVVGVEPATGNLARMRRTYPDERFAVVRAIGEALPVPDSSFDLIWVRDVLVHFESLDLAFAEFRRVLKPGGAVLVFGVFATPLLEPNEAERLWRGTAVVAASADAANFARAAGDAGLTIERTEVLHGEWREHAEESGERRTWGQLLRVARMVRDPERYKALIGERPYEEELANCLYGVYQLLGKLSAAIYVLRSPVDVS
jgi:SAM-dependent methyltransferase